MKNIDKDGLILILQEKKLKDISSKGRNQWNFLKKFNGKKVSYFMASAREETNISPESTFQESNWWERELIWNIERGNIEIKTKS